MGARDGIRTAIVASLMVGASPGFAQTAPEVLDDGSDNITIGLGGSYAPSYEGSNDYVLNGAGLVRGRVAGFNFYSRATALYLDVVREPVSAAINIEAGPTINLRLDRASRIEDARVRALGDFSIALEAGGFFGVTKNRVLHGYDFLTVRLDAVHDVSGVHDGTIVTPNIEYGTPLSRTFFVGISASADWVDGEFADAYYRVTPAGSAASGLAPYDPDAGFKNARVTLLATQSLSGDLRRGLALFEVLSYSRMLGDFKRAPIVEDVGDANQYFAAVGLSYTF